MEIKKSYVNNYEKNFKKRKDEKKTLKSEILSWLATILLCIILAFIINNFFIINAIVPSNSMENTIMTKDRFIGNRLAYKFSEPERFDIIVFKWPDDETQLFVKRIIGLPGDKVEIVDGILYINDKVIEEPYLKEAPYTSDFGPYNVPEGHYFTLGDNRNWSEDSRLWENTYVPYKNIVAKPIFKYLPSFEILLDK
ncbi:MAG: signal peptidase I [Lachnospirales bacterium]